MRLAMLNTVKDSSFIIHSAKLENSLFSLKTLSSLKPFFLLFALLSSLGAQLAFREDFRDDVEAHIPVTSDDLTSDFLSLQRLGPGAKKLKLSYHPEIENDPHYVWNGECSGPTLLAFNFKEKLDLSSLEWVVKVGSKNVGQSKLHLAFRVGEQWFVRKEPLENKAEWNSQTLKLAESTWLSLDPKTITFGKDTLNPNLKETTGIGFVSPVKPNRSKDCTRLNWFELTQTTSSKKTGKTSKKKLSKTEFLEPETPFLRSALIFEYEGEERFVRRGVIVPLNFNNRWACFDPDRLKWIVVWETPAGIPPLTYDSMAGVSFPNKKAKAKQAPRLVGKILLSEEDFSEFGESPSDNQSYSWIGLKLCQNGVILNYGVPGELVIADLIQGGKDLAAMRLITRLNEKVKNAPATTQTLVYPKKGTSPLLKNKTTPTHQTATATFPRNYPSSIAKSSQGAPFAIRNIAFPKLERPVRATDIAFRSNGDAFLSTLDGDIWRIKELESEVPNWTRIATGIFEPMAIEVDQQDRLFVLGRDQITELIDTNKNGHIDFFRNVSDAFQQTLHTRDYATSLAIGANDSFLIAKGGIYSAEDEGIENELSQHRGTVLHISSDGKEATVLADGLRLPYVGLRNDGTVFASDQQGHHIPSTPLHLLTAQQPFLGFEPTNFQKRKTPTPPLLWYPYQANRSGAAFCTTSTQAFPDLSETFLQVSWNGRLFAIETPEKGQPFSWQLPLQLDFPALNGAIHPQSGRLYVTGLGISGYKPTTPNFVGLASIEQNQSFPTPISLEVDEDSIEVTFNRPLTDTEFITPGHPLRLFNIKRTADYGSGHYLWNNEPGEHHFTAKSFQLSPDRRTFHATFDTLRRSDLFDLELNLSNAQTTFALHLFTQPSHLPPASESDLKKIAQEQKDKPDLQSGQSELGEPLFTQHACAGCHSLTGEKLTGPSLKGIAKRMSQEKLRESILKPTAEIAEGFEAAMPSFEGVIPPQDLEHLLSYLQTLK